MKSPNAIGVLLGDMEEFDRESLEKLQDWGIRAGMVEDPTAFFLLSFTVAMFVKCGASPLTISRFVAQVAELTVAELERRR